MSGTEVYDGCRVVVVGASAGIGRSFSRDVGRRGAHLVVGARRQSALDDLCAEMGSGAALPIDVMDPSSRHEFREGIIEELGQIDLLLCTVGVAHLQTLVDADETSWADTIACNVTGIARLVVECLDFMSPTGLIAVLSSETAAVPRQGLVPYAASKAALEMVIRGVRIEHPGTRITSVAVGATFPTEFGHGFGADELGRAMANWQVHGQLQEQYMESDDVGAALAGLLGAVLPLPNVNVDHLTLRSPSAVIGGGHEMQG